MRVLLGSGGFRTDERIAFLTGEMRRHFGPIRRLLFVPYAQAGHDRYVELMVEQGFDAGYELDPIHRHDDPRAAVREAEAVFIGGGNTFRLLAALYEYDLLDVIGARVVDDMPYMGVSAGTNVACPTMQTTNDMPITMPPSFKALDLVPFQINAHYYSGVVTLEDGTPHFGESRDKRINEFHEMNETPVLGLYEGGVVRCIDGRYELAGAPARLFRRGEEPVDLEPGAEITAP